MLAKEAHASGSSVQTIDRAASILETLAEHPSLSLMELSEKVQLHKATTHRIVTSLVKNGFVEQDSENKHYCISLKMFELGNKRVQNIDFLNVAKSMIRQLSMEINQTVHLVVEDRDEILYIDKYGEEAEAKMRSKVGQKAPLYCTAVGKAILATRSNSEIESYWKWANPERKTDRTITDFRAFMEEIGSIRETEYALDNEEHEEGVFCIGCTFASYKESPAGAISISLPVTEKNKQAYYVTRAKESAEKISALLGG